MTPLKNNCRHSANKQRIDLGGHFNDYFIIICSPVFISVWYVVIFNLVILRILLYSGESRALEQEPIPKCRHRTDSDIPLISISPGRRAGIAQASCLLLLFASCFGNSDLFSSVRFSSLVLH